MMLFPPRTFMNMELQRCSDEDEALQTRLAIEVLSRIQMHKTFDVINSPWGFVVIQFLYIMSQFTFLPRYAMELTLLVPRN